MHIIKFENRVWLKRSSLRAGRRERFFGLYESIHVYIECMHVYVITYSTCIDLMCILVHLECLCVKNIELRCSNNNCI